MVNKAKLLRALKADFRNAESSRQPVDERVQRWRDSSAGKLYGNEEKGKSAIVSRDTKRQSEWLVPMLVDPFVSTSDLVKCNPITFEDKRGAMQAEVLLNNQFCRQFDRYSFMNKTIKQLDGDGTVIIQTGWDYKGKEVEQEVDSIVVDDYGVESIVRKTVSTTKVLVNKPTAIVRRHEDVYLDPTCMDDMDKCNFIIVRYESDLSSLRQDGRYKNLDKISKNSASNYDYDYDDVDDTEFAFEDDPRKKLIVYEYWGKYDVDEDGIAEDVVCVWVGDTVIRLQDNPFPDHELPFIVAPFSAIPFEMYGEAPAELIEDKQKVKTAITRGFINNMAQSTNAQLGVRKGALDLANKNKLLSGKNFEYNGTREDFWQGSYNQIPGSAFDVLGLMDRDIEEITGVKGSSGSGLGSTATAARGALDSISTRRLNIVRNISENIVKKLMRKWLAYSYEFMEPKEIVRHTNEEFVEVDKDDLGGRIDIDISVSTAEDEAARGQQLAFLFQTVGPNSTPELQQKLMGYILRLNKMPAEAKDVESMEPPKQDPVEQELKQLELEKLRVDIERIKSEITRNNARGAEDTIDVEVKKQKIRLEEAKARKLHSDADRVDIEYLKTSEGLDREDKLEELLLAHDMEMEKRRLEIVANYESMKFQAKNNDKQIGVLR